MHAPVVKITSTPVSENLMRFFMSPFLSTGLIPQLFGPGQFSDSQDSPDSLDGQGSPDWNLKGLESGDNRLDLIESELF